MKYNPKKIFDSLPVQLLSKLSPGLDDVKLRLSPAEKNDEAKSVKYHHIMLGYL